MQRCFGSHSASHLHLDHQEPSWIIRTLDFSTGNQTGEEKRSRIPSKSGYFPCSAQPANAQRCRAGWHLPQMGFSQLPFSSSSFPPFRASKGGMWPPPPPNPSLWTWKLCGNTLIHKNTPITFYQLLPPASSFIFKFILSGGDRISRKREFLNCWTSLCRQLRNDPFTYANVSYLYIQSPLSSWRFPPLVPVHFNLLISPTLNFKKGALFTCRNCLDRDQFFLPLQ